MRKRYSLKNLCLMFLVAVMVVSVIAIGTPREVSAATNYKKLQYNKVISAGSKYFKVSNDKIYYSSSKSSGFKAAGFKGTLYDPESSFTDGDTILAIEDRGEDFFRLSSYTISTGKCKLLKKLTMDSNGSYWTITAVYGNAVFMTRKDFKDRKMRTYVYNFSTKALKTAMNSCNIYARSGAYLIGCNDFPSDELAHKFSLYKTTKNGAMTRVKTLGKYISYETSFVNGCVYYAKYPESSGSYDYSKMNIYCCNKDGSGVKKLGTVKSAGGSGIYSTKFTSSYCEYFDYSKGRTYRYNYSTKKTTAV